MLYKKDWSRTREWLAGWWHREVRGHWALGVTAPRERPLAQPPPPPAPDDAAAHWLDAAGNLARSEARMARTFYGGACFPWVAADLGPGVLNLLLGSRPRFMPGTVWYEPVFADPAAAELRLEPRNRWWDWTIDTTRRYRRCTEGRCLVAVPDLIEGIDILSELLGTEELLVALIEQPEVVHRLLERLDDLYFEAFDPLVDLVRDETGGNAFIAFNCWGPGRALKTQCDFSAMISPAFFAEFVVPHLARQCARVDYSVYHLDGPEAVRHLPELLRVRELKAIQWTPGAGQPPASDPVWWDTIWRPVYAAGKAAMVLGAPPEQVEPFVKTFGQAGTLILTHARSEREAHGLLDVSAGW